MRELSVSIEIKGKQISVGTINGNNETDAIFSYAKEYIENGYPSISISLPIDADNFTPVQTKNFFEGLLPEGFTRRTVAGWLHVDENDYLSILAGLGCECIGAIKIVEGDTTYKKGYYEKLTLEQVKALASEGATKSAEIVTKSHLSLTGASGKVGLMYDGKDWYHPFLDAASTYIVKQSHVRYDSIVLNEQLALMTARELGLDVTDSMIINLGDGKDADVLLASKRYDRLNKNDKILRLHQEDFAQAMGISSANKYEKENEHYLKGMFETIRKHCVNPLEDGIKLWKMTVFDFLIGNTDNHIKNRSLLYSPSLDYISLAPIYDIVSTCIYPESTRNMAYKIGTKISLEDIDRNSFREAANECGIGERFALKIFDDMVNGFEKALNTASDKLADEGFKTVVEIKRRVLDNCGYSGII
jgi:serine/threonine-protein kinase HipA